MYRRRSGIAASSVYPKKTNVAAPTTLVIVDTVFFKKPPLAISCTMTYGWMSFSYQEVAKKPLAMRPRMLSVISNSHLRFSPYSLLRKAKGKLQPHSDTGTEPCWRWLPSSSTLRKKDPMSLAKNISLAGMIIAASVLAYGNSAPLGQQDPSLEFRQVNNAVNIKRAATTGFDCAFRSTLQDHPSERSGAPMPAWNRSLPVERSHDQGETSPVTLPEPRTGILLSIGLLAVINLRWRNSRPHSMTSKHG